MTEEGFDGILIKEYEERTLSAARLYSLLRQERNIEDPWHDIVLAICAFDKLHLKDGWEFVLTNKQDIEDVGRLFEESNSPQEFREKLLELKERDLIEQMERLDLEP